jgi:hypothetical protein
MVRDPKSIGLQAKYPKDRIANNRSTKVEFTKKERSLIWRSLDTTQKY